MMELFNKNTTRIRSVSWLLLTGFLATFLLFIKCSNPTETSKVTYSGTVTLEDTIDFSGVIIELYKPIEIDTALTNLNKQYPGIGFEINQRTEFFWRAQYPIYATRTGEDGSWKIKNVEEGIYNIIARKEGFGWKALYDCANDDENSFLLKKAIAWNGSIDEDINIPENSFIEVHGVVECLDGMTITINSGTIIEFKENSKLKLNGTLKAIGKEGNRIYFLPESQENQNFIEIDNGKNVELNYTVNQGLLNGIYFKNVDSLNISFNRFRMQNIGCEIYSVDRAYLSNNIFSACINGIISKESTLLVQKNIFYAHNETAMRSYNPKNSTVKNNVFKVYYYGLAVNYGGYRYSPSFLNIYKNSFSFGKHLFLGPESKCIGNYNNFINENYYAIETSPSWNLDTLNFMHNYWGRINAYEISDIILDKVDRIGATQEGPTINFSKYELSMINW